MSRWVEDDDLGGYVPMGDRRAGKPKYKNGQYRKVKPQDRIPEAQRKRSLRDPESWEDEDDT